MSEHTVKVLYMHHDRRPEMPSVGPNDEQDRKQSNTGKGKIQSEAKQLSDQGLSFFTEERRLLEVSY